MIGKTLGSVEILEKLGQGGMGEVYRARDLKLGRDVALKLLSPEFASDPERIARFEREARTLASLHHPNIASLFGFEDVEGNSFLLMELVEGEELATGIERGPIPLDEAVEIARQIALGLEAAHQKNVVHRDLKPSNVMITPTGDVKVLDFGLARAFTGDPESPEHFATSPTITAAMTQQGVILGTAAYMSPEQARGHAVDVRADIWAFGVILWEMLHGQRLFEGATMSDTLANVLKHEISFDELPAGTPPAVRRVLERCLERDPGQRLHSIADARIELANTDPEPESTAPRRSSRLPLALVAVLALAAGFLGAEALRTPGQPRSDAAFSILVPEGSPVVLGDWPSVKVAPDGSAIAVNTAVAGRATIMIRDIDSREFRVLSRGNGEATGPFFSPDSRWVGYFQGGMIQKVSVDGGSPVEIAPMSHPRGMTWSDDGYIYFAPSYATGIHRALASGNDEPEAVTVVDSTTVERTHRWPNALPQGRGVIFTSEGSDSPGDYEDADILIWDAETATVRPLGVNGAMAMYSATGHLLVARSGTLNAYGFDLKRAEITNGPTPVFDGIAGDPASGLYSFDLTRSGDLYYLAAREGLAQRRLVWINRDGKVDPIGLPPGPYRYPQLDHRDERVVLVLGEGHGGNDDIYVLELASLDLTRFSFDRMSIMPFWDASSQSILYLNIAEEGLIKRRLADGSRPPENALSVTGLNVPSSVSSDGTQMFFTLLGGSRLSAITSARLGDPSSLDVALDSAAAEWAPAISPDSRWLAYVSDESGREEVYVQTWPLTGAKWQLSVDGGRGPRWSPDGEELFFVLYDGLFSVRISTSGGFRASRPELVFTHPMDNAGVPMSNYDVSADGQRFLVVEPDVSRVSSAVQVDLDWGRRLKELGSN